jgi:mannose-6-phosphate isomerase-like protein (cupin superfamily)
VTRRVVTGHSPDGSAIILSDGHAPRSLTHTAPRGMVNTVLWSTDPAFAAEGDHTEDLTTVVPTAGRTVALMVTFPPDSVFAEPGFDPGAALHQQRLITPGLAELFEEDSPGMHTSPTIDYAVIIDGEIVLDLGSDATVLHRGDVVVQHGTRHAWRNPSAEPSTVFFVLTGRDDPQHTSPTTV